MVRTVTTLTRLLDVLALLETDRRVQVVFTHDEERPAILGAGVAEALDRLRAPVIPWVQARKTRFDLVLAASENDRLHELDGPVVLLPHGLGFQKYYPGGAVISGMDPARLVHEGRVVPSVIALSHPDQREQLVAACPAAAPATRVIGDPGHDRLLAAKPRLPSYRAALGVGGRRFVVLASTWGRGSLFGSDPGLVDRMLASLPYDEFAVGLLLHPGIWAAHGEWQVRAWLATARDAGLLVGAPVAWQGMLPAADCVVSDAGSLSLYAAGLDIPLLLTGSGATIAAGSPMSALAEQAPRLDPDGDLRVQLDAAGHAHTPLAYRAILKQAVDAPGDSAHRLRPLLYDLLDLPEPAVDPEFAPPPVPAVDPVAPSAFVAGAAGDGPVLRFPLVPGQSAPETLAYRHLVVDADRATPRTLRSASIVYSSRAFSEFSEWGEDILRRLPDAALAASTEGNVCLVRDRAGTTHRLVSVSGDPLLLASGYYLHNRLNSAR